MPPSGVIPAPLGRRRGVCAALIYSDLFKANLLAFYRSGLLVRRTVPKSESRGAPNVPALFAFSTNVGNGEDTNCARMA